MEVQVRSELTGIRNHDTVTAAMNDARGDDTVWKVSFTVTTGERIRLIRRDFGQWVYEPIDSYISSREVE